MNTEAENALQEACEVMRELSDYLAKVHEKTGRESSSDLLEVSEALRGLANRSQYKRVRPTTVPWLKCV